MLEVTYEPPDTTNPPVDIGRVQHVRVEAERAVLGAILAAPHTAKALGPELDPGDFYQPRHETIWAAIHAVAATGALPDPILVLEHLRTTGDLKGGHLDGTYLFELTQASPVPAQAAAYAAQVRDAARLRQVQGVATQLAHIATHARVDDAVDALAHALDTLDAAAGRLGPTRTPVRHVETIDELLAGHEADTYDWVIPGLLEHQDRVILTAEEGAGKSTLLRQIGVQAACGIHPFTGEGTTPVNVLHVDVENTRRQSRRRYRALRHVAGDQLAPDRLHVELRVAGIDLTTTEDREWLIATGAHIRSDLLLIGPVYKLANGDPTEEKSAKPVAMALDAIREATDCAVILEAHPAKAPTGQKRRPHEPYGWSGWLRWPELGLWLDRDGTLSHWRGAREERTWPTKLERGGEWPWSPALTEIADLWMQIQKAREKAGRPMSQRELERATGMSKGTLHRLIGPNRPYAYAWQLANLPKNREDPP